MDVNDIINLVLGFVLGLVSSWVFWFWQVNMKPRIAISPVVAYDPNDNVVGIKIVNISRRQVSDIQAYLFVAERHGGWYDRIYSPELRWSYIFALGPNKRKKDFWDLPRASIFETKDGKRIIELMSQSTSSDKRLIFTLTATDSVSSSKIVQRVAYRLEDIKYGYYKAGARFQITEDVNQEKDYILEPESANR